MDIKQIFEASKPAFRPPLEESFLPAVLYHRAFKQAVGDSGVPVVIGLERENGQIFRYETNVLPDEDSERKVNTLRFEANCLHIERLVKFMLWQRGAYKIYIGGPRLLGEYIANTYAADGIRKFDHHFMGKQVYQKKFEVVCCRADEVPSTLETGYTLGRHLDGCRIGFDLGASDRKVSAVVNGKVVYQGVADAFGLPYQDVQTVL